MNRDCRLFGIIISSALNKLFLTTMYPISSKESLHRVFAGFQIYAGIYSGQLNKGLPRKYAGQKCRVVGIVG